MKRELDEIKILDSKGEEIGSVSFNMPCGYFIRKERSGTITHIQSSLAVAKSQHITPPSLDKNIISFREAKPVLTYLGLSSMEIAEVLDVNISTLSKWERQEREKFLGKLQSKWILEIDEFIAKGVVFFGSEEGFKSWLTTPNFALGDVKPIKILKDPFELETVNNTFEAMSWGNFI